jgi:hypothetical protein
MEQRRFLALIGVKGSGLWIDGAGLTPLDQSIVTAINGQCSFCGKSIKDVWCMAGVIGHLARICNECVERCLEIHKINIPLSQHNITNSDAYIFDFNLHGVLSNASRPLTEVELETFINKWHDKLNGIEPKPDLKATEGLSCSFCDRTQEAGNLLAGPEVYICDDCIGETAARIKTIR